MTEESTRKLNRFVARAVKLRGWWKYVPAIIVGLFINWAYFNYNNRVGINVQSSGEAEGEQFSDKNFLDLFYNFTRNRICPSQSQRYVWRYVDYKGERWQQAIPIGSTIAPFLADEGRLILSLPVPEGIPDSQHGWFERTSTTESCGLIPTWLGDMFGAHTYRSPDKPVNFEGLPHGR